MTGGAWLAGSPAGATDRVSLATAWLCFLMLVAALALGPRKALRTGRPVLNSLLRRDIGIWAGLAGLAHLAAATREVMQPAYFSRYITGPAGPPLPGWPDWLGNTSIVTGYLVGVLILGLLVLSNNWSLRRLGPVRWKRLQGASTAALFLTVAHGLVFQVIERRTGGWLAALLVVTGAILALRWRARRAIATV